MTPYLKDQLARDAEAEGEVRFSPPGDEPKINCWLDVECETPLGHETVHFMLVKGDYVRSHVDIGYVEGGHFYRYGWTPEDQIWMEDIMSVVDQVCTGVHEIHERFKMKYLGWPYEKAHASATQAERRIRYLLLEDDTILPPMTDVIKLFEAEGSGEDSSEIASKLFHKAEAQAHDAAEQANNSTGKQEFVGLKEN